MAKGIIYVMTTVVDGLIKIGKTGTESFESRMYNLEHNGYANVTGLKRKFAIEVDDYAEKESLIDELLSRSRVPNTELFAMDVHIAVELLSAFEGTQVYPKTETKEQAFKEATEEVKKETDNSVVPDGEYYLSVKTKKYGKVDATMVVKKGKYIVKKGSMCAPWDDSMKPPFVRQNASIKNEILVEDVTCNSPSTAGCVVLGKANDGWQVWKDADGKAIDQYRNQ